MKKLTDKERKQCAKELMNESIIFGNKKQKRIKLKHGATAMVDENCSKKTIDGLNELVEKIKQLR